MSIFLKKFINLDISGYLYWNLDISKNHGPCSVAVYSSLKKDGILKQGLTVKVF